VKLPPGDHHVRIKGGYVVLKDIGGKHVVATVLDRNAARVPGHDVSGLLRREGKLKTASMLVAVNTFLVKTATPFGQIAAGAVKSMGGAPPPAAPPAPPPPPAGQSQFPKGMAGIAARGSAMAASAPPMQSSMPAPKPPVGLGAGGASSSGGGYGTSGIKAMGTKAAGGL
jgi:hypothetical protein